MPPLIGILRIDGQVADLARPEGPRVMHYLGIDLGTSAIKLCVTDAAGAVIATFDAPISMDHPFPGASEQQPEMWFDTLRKLVLSVPSDMRKAIGAIGLAGQMHGAVLLDGDKRIIHPAMLWNDSRSKTECADMAVAEPGISDIASLPVMPGFTAPKLLWLKRHAPKDHARIQHVLLPKDYLGLHLHGQCLTDPSDAAGTHWLDQASGAWSDRMCEISATSRDWLPDIRFGHEVAGPLLDQAAEALGLQHGIPVAVGAGDAVAGSIGIGALNAGDGVLSLGTSGQMFTIRDSYSPNPDSLIHTYAHTLPDRWFQMAALLNGARPMAWLSGLLGRPLPDLLAEAAETPDGPLFLPYLTGERTPHGDADIRAGFWGLGEATSHGSLMRAVVEAIAFSFADAADALAKAGSHPELLLAIGGGTRSDLLLQMIADVIETPIGRCKGADVGPALGAARLARIATGGGTLEDVAIKPDIDRWFQPRTEGHARRQQRLATYRQLYAAHTSVVEAMADRKA